MASKSKHSIYREWVQTVTAGEFIGFAIPCIAGVLSVSMGLHQFQQTLLLILAGLGEGAVLGYAQSRVLRKVVPKLKRRKWILATMLAAGYAWSIGMLPSTLYNYIQHFPLFILLPIGAILGASLLFSIGFAQYVVLQNYIKNAVPWIWLNVLAWLAGLAVLFFFITIAPEGIIPTLLFSILGGLGMAVTMAFITGRFIARLK